MSRPPPLTERTAFSLQLIMTRSTVQAQTGFGNSRTAWKGSPGAQFLLDWRRVSDSRYATGNAASLLLPSNGALILNPLGQKTKRPHKGAFSFSGGERGIRTLGTVSPYTRFPGEHLKPLSHLSESIIELLNIWRQVSVIRFQFLRLLSGRFAMWADDQGNLSLVHVARVVTLPVWSFP